MLSHALKQKINLRNFSLFLCAAIGIAIQIQATIGASPTSFGLRVNVADMLLPAMAALTGLSLLFNKSHWPQWQNIFGIFLPAALTIVMIFALWNGHQQTGEWSHWAIINKFTGWFILMGYFGFGAWAAANFGNPAIRFFLKAFVITFTVIAVINSLILLLGDFGIAGQPFQQLSGLMGNRNAMGLIILMTFTILSVYSLSDSPILPAWIVSIFLALLPLLLILSGSRATWLAFIIPIVGITLVFGFRAIKLFRVAVLSALIIIPTLLMINGERGVFRELQNQHLAQLGQTIAKSSEGLPVSLSNNGDQQRLRVFQDSMTFWKDHPITGIGLGSFIRMQADKYQDGPKIILGIIDSSPLWVLTETGILGAVLFVAFFIVILRTCWQTGWSVRDQSPDSDSQPLRMALLLIVLSFAFMSLFHELLYTRIIWFMLGLGLVVSSDESKRIRADI